MIAYLVDATNEGPGWVQVLVTAIVTLGSIATAALAAGVWRRQTAVKTSVEQVAEQVKKVDTAVSNVPHGHPTLVQRVTAVEAHVVALDRRQDGHGRWMTDALKAIGGQLGVELPDRRHYDQEVES